MVKMLKTKDKAALKEKLKKQAGFTLVELLIVVAIIAILAAVAIPAYSAQMESSRLAVDNSALSSAASMAAADYLLNNYKGDVTYSAYQSNATNGATSAPTTEDTRNLYVKPTAGTGAGTSNTKPGDYSAVPTTPLAPQAKANDTKKISVVITDGGVVKSTTWA